MNRVSAVAFVALIATPLVHAQLLSFVRGQRRMHRVAVLGCVATLAVALWLSWAFTRATEHGMLVATLSPFGAERALHFGVDALNAPLLPLHCVLSLAFVLSSPRAMLGRSELRALLWLESLTLWTLSTLDLLVVGAGFALVLVPSYRLTLRARGPERPLLSRVFIAYHGIGAACCLGAVSALTLWTAPPFTESFVALDASAVPATYRSALFALLSVAALVRMGVAPFHSWLPVSLEHGHASAVALLVSTRTGLYVLARLALPLFPSAARGALPVLIALALVSAVYGSLAALGQRDLRRLVGFLVVSQSGIMLTGFALGDVLAISGALLYWIGFGIATTGLVIMLNALRARTGSSDIQAFGGIVRELPKLSFAFFLFGLATIAVPGSVAFAAEEMLVHGALGLHPVLTVVMILSMVLNAITFVRAFAHAFLGERRSKRPRGTMQDLGPREHLTAAALLLLLFSLGVVPRPVVALQTLAAHEIARIAQGEAND